MTIEELLRKESDKALLDIQEELYTGKCPATGYAHTYCKSINRRIDAGLLCVHNYRKVYLPTLTKLVNSELATRYAEHKLGKQRAQIATKYVITGKLRNGVRFKPIYTDQPWNYNIWQGTIWELLDNEKRRKVKDIDNV